VPDDAALDAPEVAGLLDAAQPAAIAATRAMMTATAMRGRVAMP
jgi:hypothetical protein